MWSRYVAGSVGPGSNGKLPWTTNVNGEGIYAFAAAANAALLGGYGDWRIPNELELVNLRDLEQPTAMPDAVAFPGWINDYILSSTTHPYDSTYAVVVLYTNGARDSVLKTAVYYVALVRGG
jgi:hypothetical protein